MAQGGTELAPMSTTSDLSVAMRYSASSTDVLLRLITESFMQRGPDICFLSAFPGEAEFLFPPLTYLQPTGDVRPLVQRLSELNGGAALEVGQRLVLP